MKQNISLRLARIDAGLTQEELAGVLGISSITVYRWERGENIPTPYFRARLCRLFQVSEQALGWSEAEKEALSRRCSSILVDPCIPASKVMPIGQQTLLKDLVSSRSHTLGLIGLPGSGKTTIVQALAEMPEMQQQVAGILWAEGGQEAKPLRHLQRWLMLLGGEVIPEHLEKLQDSLRVLMNGRKMLILLDDLWETRDIVPYQIGLQCRYVVTTRLPVLASTLCDAVYSPHLLTETQAFNLLTRGLPSVLMREYHQVLHALSQQVGYLPEAIEQMGTYLRREARSHSQRRFQEALTHLFHPASYLNIQIPSDAPSLAASLKRSEKWLSPSSQQAFSVLATHFPAAPAAFSEQQVTDLFQRFPQFQLHDLDQLVDVGLLSGVGRNRYQFHPVVAAYARLTALPSEETNK